MPLNMSEKQLASAYIYCLGNLYGKNEFLNKILFYIFKLKVLLKNIFIKIFYKDNVHIEKYNFENIKVANFDQAKDSLSSKGYYFFNDFFDDVTYKKLLKNWPSLKKFNLMPDPLKYYFIGRDMIAVNNDGKIIGNKYYKIYENFYKYLFSKNFLSEINKITDGNDRYVIRSVLLSYVFPGSFLIPHQDSVSESIFKPTYNFIYFLEGNDEEIEYSGRTGIYNDKDFEKPLFIPKSLNNTCLLYTSNNSQFHGFKRVKEKCYRKALTFNIWPKDHSKIKK